MTCPLHDVYTAPPRSDLDLWVRYVMGHRRVFGSYLDEVAAHGGEAFGVDATWVRKLLSRSKVRGLDVAYATTQAAGARPGPRRYRLNRAGQKAVRNWLALGTYWNPIGTSVGEDRAVLLLLWGSGCVASHDRRYTREFARRQTLSAIIPGGERVARRFTRHSEPGLHATRIATLLTKAAGHGDAGTLELRDGACSPARVGKILARLLGAEESLIETIHPEMIPGVPRFGSLVTATWTLLRRELPLVDPSVLPERSRLFAESLAARSVTTHAMAPKTPTSVPAIAEALALETIQQIMAAVYRSHPGAIAMSASLWSLTGVSVYRNGHAHAGRPSALDVRSGLGKSHPSLRSTWRTPDGVMFVPGDDDAEPSLWIEYEGDRSNLHTRDHVYAALAMSSRWAKRLTLVNVVTPEAEAEVLSEVRVIDTDGLVAKGWVDWPGADVDVRVVRHRDAVEGCLLCAPSLFDLRFRAEGSPLRRAT